MFSDLPASEVLASHMASSERAKGEEGREGLDPGKSDITYPSHLGQAVRAVTKPCSDMLFELLFICFRELQFLALYQLKRGSRMCTTPQSSKHWAQRFLIWRTWKAWGENETNMFLQLHFSGVFLLLLFFCCFFFLAIFRYIDNMAGLEDIQEGGGFLPGYGCRRALQEAFSCLFYFPDNQ